MVIIAIHLDGSNGNKFYPGQNVTGNVRVETRDEIKMRGIRLEVHGNATVRWEEGSGDDERSYNGHEIYIGSKWYLTGSAKDDSKMILKPGVDTFPFSFVLPNNAPSSFEGSIGSIRYKVQAIVDRAWKIDNSAEISITVVRLLDLNHEPPQLREPIAVHVGKHIVGLCYHCCCIKGHPDIQLRINRGCFVPGETIVLSGQVINKSNSKILQTKITFMQEIQFCATSRGTIYRRRNLYKTLGSIRRPPIDIGSTDSWSDVTFTVPSVPASRLDECKIINITYLILVKAEFGRGCAESAMRKDIIIGHIPLQGDSQFGGHIPLQGDSQFGGPITTQPSLYTSPFQSGFSEQSNYGAVLNQDNSATSVAHR